jgi:uncharacterized protein (DUF952 family)
MTVKEIIKLVEQDGWYLARTKGSHRQDKHQIKMGFIYRSFSLDRSKRSPIWQEVQLLRCN